MKLNDLIHNWSKAQKAGAVLPCPRCGKDMKNELAHNALSRRADVYICDKCGMEEALCDARRSKDDITKWFIATSVLRYPDIYKESEDVYKLKVQRVVTLTNEDIDDIMCTALEGGITWWCCKAEVVEDEYLGEYASEQISRGGSLRLYDSEEDKTYILTLEKFLKGFSLACVNVYGQLEDWFDDDCRVDPGSIDAIGADSIIQYALFGELVFG